MIVGIGLNAAGIHQGEFAAAPVTFAIDTVPGYAGGVLHNGEPAADEFIKQHGLAHIGPAHNSDHRFCHRFTSLQSENGIAQVKAVNAYHLHRRVKRLRELRDGPVVQKYILLMPEHMQGDQHPA